MKPPKAMAPQCGCFIYLEKPQAQYLGENDRLRLDDGYELHPFCVAITAAKPLKPRPPAKPLTADELDRLWTQLASDGAPTFDAVELLAGVPAHALPFLGPRFRAAGSTADTKKIAALIAKLDDDSFDERETATKELEKLGLEALLQLRQAAAETKSAEVRERAEDLLAKLANLKLTPDRKRLQAALCVLELIGSAEARKMLQEVATTPANPWLAAQAEETLKRMPKN